MKICALILACSLPIFLMACDVAEKSGKLAMLPLRHGYYVASDTSCDQASNATIMRVHRNGINSSRLACEFTSIEQTGPRTFRTIESCKDIQGEEPVDVGTVTYTVPDETHFTSESEQDWKNSARYCPQSDMPPLWRENILED